MYFGLALAVITLTMAYLGYHYSIPQTASPRTRLLLRIAFIGLGGISVLLIGIQGYKTDKDQQQAKEQALSAKQQAEAAQQITERKLDDQQLEISSLKGQVNEIRNIFLEPGGPIEKMVNVADTLGIRVSPSTLAAHLVQNDVPFKGGLAQRLDALMKADGYLGTTLMAELYVQSDDENQISIRIGPQAKLTAKNSSLLEGGERMDYRNGADTRGVYILSDKDGKIDVTYRPR